MSSHREIAAGLDRLAEQMAACRDLPMGRHDMAVMVDPSGQAAAFRRFVAVERELVALLNTNLTERNSSSRKSAHGPEQEPRVAALRRYKWHRR